VFYLLYLLIPLAYIMGSIPFGIIISKKKGIDPRQRGSKNIGATNVLRTVGKTPALLTLIGDILKGAIPVLICRVVVGYISHQGDAAPVYRDEALWEGIVGVMAILGHVYPVFLKFKGGKGVATAIGVFISYTPLSTIFTILVWLLVAVTTRYSSLSAIVASLSLPFFILFFDGFSIKIYFGIFIAMLIIYRHGENIKRLIRGTEHRFGKGETTR